MKQLKNFVLHLRNFFPKVISMSEHCGSISKIDKIVINTVFTRHTLYIGTQSQVQNTIQFLSDLTLFLVEDMDHFELPDKAQSNIVVFPANTSIEVLYQSCVDYFHEQGLVYEHAYTLFDTFLSHKKGIPEIVNTTAELVGNPIMLLDTSYKIIAYSTNIPVDDFQWNDNQSRKYCSYEYVSMFSDINNIKNSAKEETPFFSGCLVSPYRHCISNLISNNKCLGYLLSIEAVTEFTDQSVNIIEIASRLLSKITDMNKKATKSVIDSDFGSILLDCLVGNYTSREELQNSLKVTGMDIDGQFYILAIDIENYHQKTLDNLNDHINKSLDSLVEKHIKVIYKNEVIILVRSKLNYKVFTERLKKDHDFYVNNNLRAGVSACYNDLFLTNQAWVRAKRVLQMAKKLNPSENISFYEDYKLYDLILSGLQKNNIDSFISNECNTIIAYDETNNTQYFETLYNYIYNNKNLKKTAEQLCIHKNTVSYRTNRAKELFDLELDDPHLRINFTYSYMLQMLKKSKWFEL